MKPLISLNAVSLNVALVLAALVSGAAFAGNDLETIRSAGVITVGTDPTYAPFTYHDPASGELTGFDVDIARAVAHKLGVKVQFVEAPWAGLIAGVDVHRYDLVANEIEITPPRQLKYGFSAPYIVSRAVAVVNTGNNTIHSFQDLKGKNIVDALSSNYGQLALKYGAKVTDDTDSGQSYLLVEQGRVDATLDDRLGFLQFKKQQPNAPLKIAAANTVGQLQGLLFRKDQPELKAAIDKALADIKADGTYLRISEKYFGEDVSH